MNINECLDIMKNPYKYSIVDILEACEYVSKYIEYHETQTDYKILENLLISRNLRDLGIDSIILYPSYIDVKNYALKKGWDCPSESDLKIGD